MRIRVDHITGPVLGKELLKRCGDEGSEQRLNLTDGVRRVLRFLTEAIFFMPLRVVMNEGADLQNTAFIFAQPGKELILLSWPEMVIGNSISRKVLMVIFVGDVSACHASGTFGPDKVTSSASWVVSNTAPAFAT